MNFCRVNSNKNSIDPQPPSELDTMDVEPHRSQIRSVLIFAKKKALFDKENKRDPNKANSADAKAKGRAAD